MNKTIIQNECECAKCGDIIWSAHRHDFKSCKCEAISVDGGMDYIRRVGNPEDIIEKSLSMDKEDLTKCIEAVDWGKETGRNSLGIALAVIRALRDTDNLNMEKFQ